jgi:tetratricopeptide (TPR) repeat protein
MEQGEPMVTTRLPLRGDANVNQPILVKFFDVLRAKGEPTPAQWRRFHDAVQGRYTEGTLIRLLTHHDAEVREAALVALRLLGTMEANAAVAACLHDPEAEVRELAEGTLWSLWFHAGQPDENEALQKLARQVITGDARKARTALNRLAKQNPKFAEVVNQRAILAWRIGEYRQAITDCKKVLELNPYHFAAQAGLGQCYLALEQPDQALAAFRKAHEIHPHLQGIGESIAALEQFLGEDGSTRD